MSSRSCVVSSTVVPCRALRSARNVAHAVLAHDVEADRRLVEEQQLGTVQQRGGELAAHALPERELAHRRAEELVELEQLDALVEPGAVRAASTR